MKRIVLLGAFLLSACAHRPCIDTSGGQWCAAPLPATPAFAEQEQSIIMEREGDRQQAVASVSWTSQFIEQQVLTPFGQPLYRLRFEQDRLVFERGNMPFLFAPEYALLDMQLMIWPVELIEPQLPRDWRLEQDVLTGDRRLYERDQLVAEVRIADNGERHLIHHRRPYQLWVKPLSTR